MMEGRTRTWWRIGMDIYMTDEDLEILRNGNCKDVSELVMHRIKSGEFRLNGDSYMPYECAEEIGVDGEIEAELWEDSQW